MNRLGKIYVIEAFKSRQEPESVHVLADAYWHLLAIVCILGTIAIMTFSFWEFTDVDRALAVQPATVQDGQGTLPFEKSDLQKVVDGFAQRKAAYDFYATQAPAVTDPSVASKSKLTR